jgi:protein phosphatase-4 regulatory subunit 3
MEGWSEKNEFLEVFYDKFMDKLLAALSGPLDPAAAAAAGGANSPGGSAAGQRQPRPRGVAPSTIGLIVDLLCFCVQHHAYRAKYHILRKAVVEKVLGLLRRRERWLVVAAVRFMRTCIGTKDDFYFRWGSLVASGPRAREEGGVLQAEADACMPHPSRVHPDVSLVVYVGGVSCAPPR